MRDVLFALDIKQPFELSISEHNRAKYWLAQVDRVGDREASLWATTALPGISKRSGIAVRLPDDVDIPIEATTSFIEKLLGAIGADAALETMRKASDELPVLIAYRAPSGS